jgi:hypothetical protein
MSSWMGPLPRTMHPEDGCPPENQFLLEAWNLLALPG